MADEKDKWTSWEQGKKDEAGKCVWPFYAELAKSGKVPAQPLKKMQLAQDHGWPEAKDSMRGPRGELAIVQKDDLIWLLKCKPSCWRLYFYVREKEKRFVYVLSVCKQQRREDPSHAKRARRLADSGGVIKPIFGPR